MRHALQKCVVDSFSLELHGVGALGSELRLSLWAYNVLGLRLSEFLVSGFTVEGYGIAHGSHHLENFSAILQTESLAHKAW